MYPNIEDIFYNFVGDKDHDSFLHQMTKDSDQKFKENAETVGESYNTIEELNAACCCDYEKAGFIYGFRTAVKLITEAL